MRELTRSESGFCVGLTVAAQGLGVVAVCLLVATQGRTGQASEPSDSVDEISEAPFVSGEVPKFELDIQPLLTAHGCNAGACHGKARGQNGFALSLLGFDSEFDYHAIVTEARGRRIFPSAPEHSLLLRKASGRVPHGGGVRLPANSAGYRAIVSWIRAGMPRATEGDPAFERIAIAPKPRTLQPEEEEQLTVTAYYSDGSQRDVTAASYFQSNETTVVKVTDVGQLIAGELPGEATVMARYMGRIATWSTAIPGPKEISNEHYDELPRNNFIDDLVWQKLEQLNVLPSEPIDDAKFMRRVYLDLIGRLPSAEEAREFLGSESGDKRERLVDRLLDRPEYADFWANKWADLLRPNPYRVGIKATLSLDGWLREAFRQNMRYDEFARQLMTARGSTWRNGAVTVFRDRRSPDEITTMFSQLFLGTRLECAKCHQHPFEVYGQEDFYSLAAYFAKVGYKGKGLSPPISGGEEIITLADKGSVTHPVTGEVLEPRPLWGECREVQAGEDPREVLVEWMRSEPEHRFAQAGANRIWGELFGVGIVDPVDDMRATNPPSNPALLRALGDEFRRVDYDQQALIKTLTMSQVYALCSLPNSTNAEDHRNYSRHYRRLSRAEVVADALSDVIGIPFRFDGMPREGRAMQLWTFRAGSDVLDAFGRPDPNQDPPCERLPDATMTQALHLMNAPEIQTKLTDDTSLPARLAERKLAPDELLDELYLRVYSRFPADDEYAALTPLLQEPDRPLRRVLEDILWSLLNSPEFSYED